MEAESAVNVSMLMVGGGEFRATEHLQGVCIDSR